MAESRDYTQCVYEVEEKRETETNEKAIKRRERQRIVSSRPTIILLCQTYNIIQKKGSDEDGEC